MNSQRLIAVLRWMTAAAVLAGIVALYYRWLHVNPTTVALTLLMFVLFLAAQFGLRYAVVTSIAATFCYNYFFLPPLRTFVINDPQNWLGLFVFLTVSVVSSGLAERAREQALDARRGERELETLYGLSRELLQTENVATLLNALAPATLSVTRATAVLVYLLDADRRYFAGARAAIQTDDVSLRQLALTLPSPDVVPGREARVPLRVGVRPRGVMMIAGADLSVETLAALGGLVSIAIDRAQALESVTKGEAAKESERMRSLMIDSITHELRTPLTAIKASATALMLAGAMAGAMAEAERRDLLEVIDEESDRLNRLVSQAVEMAQLDTQDIRMTFRTVGVREMVDAAVETCAGVLAGYPLTVRLPELPSVEVDREYIEKVICNLLENAAKYSVPGSPIFLSGERRGGSVTLSVADRGSGIDISEQSLIFDRFYRAGGNRQQVSGTGMGLSISRSFVEAHHGTLRVTSQLGEGSVFSFSLPIAHEVGDDRFAPPDLY